MDVMDLSIRPILKDMAEKAHARVWIQYNNGAGLQMDLALREFLAEYNSRAREHGMDSMPANFNVMEAFFNFLPNPGLFSLYQEVDHLFSMPTLIDYATSDAPSDADADLMHIQETCIYSYNICSALEDQLFSVVGNINFAIGGVSFIRHGRELSAIMLCGEQTDLGERSKKAARDAQLMETTQDFVLRRPFGPDPELKPEAVPLLGSTNFARSLVLARIDLVDKTFDARYLLSDAGNHYSVTTDDYACGLDTTTLAEQAEKLSGYEALFHALRVMLHLPTLFARNKERVKMEKRETTLGTMRSATQTRKAKKHAVVGEALNRRTISVLDQVADVADLALFVPPKVVVETKGYWKNLRHDDVGTDKDGKPIHGRTWVEEKATWMRPDRWKLLSVSKPTPDTLIPPDTSTNGHIYIMRCITHAENIFKVGLTRRTVNERAAELSASTSSPTTFYPVLSWEVSDCVEAEKEIHELLSAFRVSGSREFFCAPVGVIVQVAQPVIMKYKRHPAA